MIDRISRKCKRFKACTISGALDKNEQQVRASHCLSVARTNIVRASELRSPRLFLLRSSNLSAKRPVCKPELLTLTAYYVGINRRTVPVIDFLLLDCQQSTGEPSP